MVNNIKTPEVTAIDSNAGNLKWIVPYIGALIAMMLLQFNNLGFTPLLPSMVKAWGINNSQLGFFTGLNGILSLIMAVPAGLLVVKFGVKKVVYVGLVVVALGLSIVALSPNFGMGIFGRIVWMTGYKATFIAVISALAFSTPEKFRGTGFAINGSMSALAVVLGAPLGSYMTQNYGWQTGMYTYAVLALVGLIIFAVLYRVPIAKTEPTNAHVNGATNTGEAKRSAYRTPMVWLMALLMFVSTMIGISLTFFMPTMFTKVYNFKPLEVAVISSTGFGIGVVVVFLFGFFADRLRNRKLILAIIMGIDIICGLFMLIPQLSCFEIGVIASLAVSMAIPNLIYAIASQVLAGRQLGNVIGVVGLGMGAGAYIGPQAVGFFADMTGHFTAGIYFLTGSAIVSLILVLCLNLNKSDKKSDQIIGASKEV